MMKTINQLLYLTFILAFIGLSSCDDDIEKAVLKSTVSANQLNNLPSSTLVLTYDNANVNTHEFTWAPADFGFKAAVNYTLEVDVAGAGFANAVELGSTYQLKFKLTEGELNAAMLALGLTPEEASDVEFRLLSDIGSGIDKVASTVLDVNITPFATTFPPIYIIGAAQSWDLAKALELTATGPGAYEGTGEFIKDGIFRFFETPSWDANQWNFNTFQGGNIDAKLSGTTEGDANFTFLADDGLYHISVNLNTKTIVIEEQNFPSKLFIIGADQGWSLDAALELKHLGTGVFEAKGTFGNGNIWRFFESPDWGAKQWNYNTFIDGTLDPKLSGTTEGDANFTFEGETGIYVITVSTIDLTITMEATSEPTLFIIGDDQQWDLGNAFQLTWEGGYKYSGSTTFNNNSIFRFFESASWGAKQYNYNTFLDGTIDETNLSGTTEGDANFTFIGTSGTYTIEVDLLNLTISLSQ